MYRFRNIFLLIVILFLSTNVFGQSEPSIDNKILFRKEQTGSIMVHSGGFGIGYHNGKSVTFLRKFMWEIEVLSIKHPKEYKVSSYYQNSKNFIFGKLNSFYTIRGGVGQQHVLNRKPYWGGVEVRLFYYGGISLGITKAQYLNIVKIDEVTGNYKTVQERYDPAVHAITDIFSKGSFFKGFNYMGIYPGLYAKIGLSFEYGADEHFVKALECGVFADGFYKNVPIMAYQKNQFIFVNAYIGLHFGKRKL